MKTFGFPRLILFLDAVAFIAVGVCFLAAPGWLLPKVGLEAASGTALADVRAVYGGLDAAIGVFLALCLRRAWIAAGLACGTIAFAGLVLGRSIGLAADAPHTSLSYILLGSEVAGLILSGAAWKRARAQAGPSSASAV